MGTKTLFVVGVHVTQTKRIISRAKKFGFDVVLCDKKEKLEKNLEIIKDADGLYEIDFENYDGATCC